MKFIYHLPTMPRGPHHPALAQEPEVIGHFGLRGVCHVHELGHRGRPAREVLQHFEPQGIRQRLRQFHGALVGIHHNALIRQSVSWISPGF
jgi:hypothetical protein